MSSTAHWLVLGAVASRERVLSTRETERVTCTHSICTQKPHMRLLVQAFRGPQSISRPASPFPPLPRFVLPPLPMSSSSCGKRSSSHFGLPKGDGKKKEKKKITSPSTSSSQISSVVFRNVLKCCRRGKQLISRGGKRARPVCSPGTDQSTTASRINIRYYVSEPTLKLSNVCLD